MPWIYNDSEINGIIDSNIKDSPPSAPMINTAAIVRSCLKLMWAAMRGQVSTAVANIDAANSSLIARSLNLNATIYIDGVNGNDARTGATNDSNATTGKVKTWGRVAALHNAKTYKLTVDAVNTSNVTADTTLDIPLLLIINRVSITFNKKNIVGGEGNCRLFLRSSHVIVYTEGATIATEGHSAPIAGATYYDAQGGFVFQKMDVYLKDVPMLQQLNFIGGTLNVGNNTILVTSGRAAWADVNPKASVFYASYYSPTTVNLGTGAVFHDLLGDRLMNRPYTPTSSTDTNISEGETVVASTGKLWTKKGGVVKDAMGTTFI